MVSGRILRNALHRGGAQALSTLVPEMHGSKIFSNLTKREIVVEHQIRR
jgi:hypothetical protein